MRDLWRTQKGNYYIYEDTAYLRLIHLNVAQEQGMILALWHGGP